MRLEQSGNPMLFHGVESDLHGIWRNLSGLFGSSYSPQANREKVVIAKQLPPRPSLQSLHNQAKQLLLVHRANDADARRRFSASQPRFSDAEQGIRLSDAQLVIAREYGFESWSKLQRSVEEANGVEATIVTDADSLTPAWITPRRELNVPTIRGRINAIIVNHAKGPANTSTSVLSPTISNTFRKCGAGWTTRYFLPCSISGRTCSNNQTTPCC